MNRIAAILLSVAALALVGCEATGDRDTSAATVSNEREGAWGGDGGWTVEEQWRVGGSDATGPATFSARDVAVATGPNGQVLVADLQASEIRVFDRGGAFVRTIGREGEGPGELRTPLGLGWDHRGRLWVPDLPNLRYTLFDSVGTFLDSFQRPPRGLPRLIRPVVFDEEGAMLAESEIRLEDGSKELVLIRQDSESGAVLDTLPPITMPRWGPPPVEGRVGPARAAGPGGLGRVAYFRPRLVYSVSPTGIWFSDSDELRLIHRTLDADTLLIAETEHRDDLNLSAEDRRMIDEYLRETGLDPEHHPFDRQVVQSIHVMDDDYVLVQIEEEPGQDGNVLDVFDPDGRFLGTIDLGFAMDASSPPASIGDTLFVVGKDAMDAKFLARLVIHR